MTQKKLLSIIIVGRNDDYLGGYRYRLQVCLDFLAMNLRRLGRLDEVEVVYVDWNSADRPLSDDIRLTDDAAELIRFVIVPPEVARKRNPTVSFFTTCAVNVGVRRARGAFIMLADSDCIMPLPSLRALLEVLDGTREMPAPLDRLIFPIPRHQVPGPMSLRQPNVLAWEYHLSRIFASRRKELAGGDCLGGFSAAQLMHRDLWFEFGGYNEKLDRAWGWSDNDLMLRVTRRYSWADVGFHGVVAFHIQHHVSNATGQHQRDPDSVNRTFNTFVDNPNEPDWGLASVALSERTVKGAGPTPREAQWDPIELGPLTAGEIDRATEGVEFVQFCALVRKLTFDHALTPRFQDLDQTRLDDAAITTAAIAMVSGRPRNALYVGSIHPTLLFLIISGNPGIDLFLSRCWPEGDLADETSGPGVLAVILANAPFMGFARILNGPAVGAIPTLRTSERFAVPIEFAIVHRNDIEAEFDAVLAQLLLNLAPGGSIIVTDKARRLPRDEANMPVYLGRLLSRAAASPDRRSHAFCQTSNEEALGREFVGLPMHDGAVHLIRRRPTAVASRVLKAS